VILVGVLINVTEINPENFVKNYMIQLYFSTCNVFHPWEMKKICVKIMTTWERGIKIPGKIHFVS
jgi:hypothetical protein